MAATSDPRFGPVFNTTGSRDQAKVMNINGNYIQGKPNRTSNFSRNKQRQIAQTAPADSGSHYDPSQQGAGFGFPPQQQQQQLPPQEQQGYQPGYQQSPPRYNNVPRGSLTAPENSYGRRSAPPVENANQSYQSNYQPSPPSYQVQPTSQLTNSYNQPNNRQPSSHPSYIPPPATHQPQPTDQLSNSFNPSYNGQPSSSYNQLSSQVSQPYEFQMPPNQNQADARGTNPSIRSDSLFDFTAASYNPQATSDLAHSDRTSSRPQIQSSLFDFGAADHQPLRTDELRSSYGGGTAPSNRSYGGSPDQALVSSYQATPPPHHPQETPQQNVSSPGSPPVNRQWIMPNANTRLGTEQWTIGTLPSNMTMPPTNGQTLSSSPNLSSQELTLSVIENSLKFKLPVRANPPEVYERAEEEYVKTILNQLASAKRFELYQCTYVSKISRRVPKLFPRLFVYQLARLLFDSKTDPRKVHFCDQQLRVWGKLDRAEYLEKEAEIEEILMNFKLDSEDEQTVASNVNAILEIDEIGNAAQTKLARRAAIGVITT